MPSPLPSDVRAEMAAGKTLEAIRLLRQQTGLSLIEAQAAVRTGFVPDSVNLRVTPGIPQEVTAALAAGNKLQAIKLLRQIKGLSLKQAKSLAEEVQLTRQVQQVPGQGRLSPGELPRTSLGSVRVLVVLIIAAAVAWFAFGGA